MHENQSPPAGPDDEATRLRAVIYSDAAERLGVVRSEDPAMDLGTLLAKVSGSIDGLTDRAKKVESEYAELLLSRAELADEVQGLRERVAHLPDRVQDAEATVERVRLVLADLRRAYPDAAPYDTASVTIDRLTAALDPNGGA